MINLKERITKAREKGMSPVQALKAPKISSPSLGSSIPQPALSPQDVAHVPAMEGVLGRYKKLAGIIKPSY